MNQLSSTRSIGHKSFYNMAASAHVESKFAFILSWISHAWKLDVTRADSRHFSRYLSEEPRCPLPIYCKVAVRVLYALSSLCMLLAPFRLQNESYKQLNVHTGLPSYITEEIARNKSYRKFIYLVLYAKERRATWLLSVTAHQ